MITPAFKILESFHDTGAVGGQLPRFGKRIAIGIGELESAAIEPNNGQTILFNESLHILPSPVCASSRPLQAYEVATFACNSTEPLESPEQRNHSGYTLPNVHSPLFCLTTDVIERTSARAWNRTK